MPRVQLIAEGALYGHLSHLYDFSDEVSPLTFAEIEDIFIKVSQAKLQVGEKLDGQTIHITFIPHETDAKEGAIVLSLARKADVLTAPQAIKDPASALGSLAATITRFAGRNEELRNAFVDSLTALDISIKNLDLETQRAIFGPDEDGDYNWFMHEIMDPENPNVINYNKYGPILGLHVEGHAVFSSKTRDKKVDLWQSEEVDGTEHVVYAEPVKLYKQALSQMNKSLENQSRFRVISNELRNLKKEFDASSYIQKLDKEISKMSRLGITKESDVAEYALARILDENAEEILSSFRMTEDTPLTEEMDLEPLTSDFMQLLDEKTYSEYTLNIKALIRTILDGKSRKREILANIKDSQQRAKVESIISRANEIKIDAVSPIEMIVHDFAVEALEKFESAYVLSQDESTENFRQMVSKDISQIQTAFDDPDSPLYGDEKKRSKFDRQKGKVRDVTTSAEGFTFVYKGHWYKFTGNFAPLNQILGMKPGKFVREQLENDRDEEDGPIAEGGTTYIFIPGGFKPPHADHWKLLTKSLERYPGANVVILVGGKPRECGENHCITAQMSEQIWETMIVDQNIGADVEVLVHGQPVKYVYDFLANNTKAGDTLIGVYGLARGDDDRFKNLKKLAPEGVIVINEPVETLDPDEGGASGTALRKLIYASKKEEFFNFMPVLSDEARDKIWDLISPKTKINLEEINDMIIKELSLLREATLKVRIKKKEDLEEVSSVGGAGSAFQGFSGNPFDKKLLKKRGF